MCLTNQPEYYFRSFSFGRFFISFRLNCCCCYCNFSHWSHQFQIRMCGQDSEKEEEKGKKWKIELWRLKKHHQRNFYNAPNNKNWTDYKIEIEPQNGQKTENMKKKNVTRKMWTNPMGKKKRDEIEMRRERERWRKKESNCARMCLSVYWWNVQRNPAALTRIWLFINDDWFFSWLETIAMVSMAHAQCSQTIKDICAFNQKKKKKYEQIVSFCGSKPIYTYKHIHIYVIERPINKKTDKNEQKN